MKINWKAYVAALFTMGVVMLTGVILFFNPIAEADMTNGPLVPPLINFLIYVVLIVSLFDWTARQIQRSYKAGFAIGTGQFLLVNVDYVLSGKRGLMTAGASSVLMLATWITVIIVYNYFIKWNKKDES